MDQNTIKEIAAIWDKINNISKQLSDFTEILNEQRASDIDYIAMESNIELNQEEEK